jgi:hypothetical protein
VHDRAHCGGGRELIFGMKLLRICLSVGALGGIVAGLIFLTLPPRPITILIGLSAAEQEKIAAAKDKREFEAALKGFEAKLNSAAGPNAIDCGVLPLHEQSTNVIACAARALHDQLPFSLAIEDQGVDTID